MPQYAVQYGKHSQLTTWLKTRNQMLTNHRAGILPKQWDRHTSHKKACTQITDRNVAEQRDLHSYTETTEQPVQTPRRGMLPISDSYTTTEQPSNKSQDKKCVSVVRPNKPQNNPRINHRTKMLPSTVARTIMSSLVGRTSLITWRVGKCAAFSRKLMSFAAITCKLISLLQYMHSDLHGRRWCVYLKCSSINCTKWYILFPLKILESMLCCKMTSSH